MQFNSNDTVRVFTSIGEPRNSITRIHYHSLIEISLILGGKGCYKINNKLYSIGAGDIFFFRPNESHCLTNVEEGGIQFLNVHISPYYLYTNFHNPLGSNYIKLLTAGFPLKSNKMNDTLTEAQAESVRNLMLTVHREFESSESDYTTLVCNHISTIMILFSRYYGEIGLSRKDRQSHKKLLLAIEYIDAHYKECITLDALAQRVAYSRCYFSSVFRKSMGMSLWDYITIKRIEEAVNMIKTTDLNIADVALECGFNSVVNFNKLFKKYTNLTPSCFRS